MFRKILIPLDGSPLAERALLHVLQLAPPNSVELVLVNVIETYRYSATTMGMTPVDVLRYVRSGIEAYIENQRSQLEARQYAVQTYILEGDAAGGILEVADTTEADLIIMTTHGRSGVARWALGSVAERVIHNAPLPVWLVRENTRVISPHEMQRILVPLDGSAMAETALDQAQSLAQETGAELLLLRVVPEPDDINRRMIFATESSAQTALATWRNHAEQYLARVVQERIAAGIVTRTLVTSGAPVRSMLDTISTESIDAIVMATHARLGFDRLLRGSVAAEVLRHAGCPLLLVHATEAAVPEPEPVQLASV
jgi:nucleotide-binding universal stress UspA family protein